MFFIATLWYFLGSSLLSTHQLGGFAGSESGASLQTFPGEYQRSRPQGRSLSVQKIGLNQRNVLEGLNSGLLVWQCCESTRPLTLPLPPHLCLPSRLSPQQSAEDVSQFDSKFTSQTPVDSPDDSTLSESANQAFLVTSQATVPHLLFVESGNYSEYGTMFSMLGKHPKTFKILFLSLHTHHLLNSRRRWFSLKKKKKELGFIQAQFKRQLTKRTITRNHISWSSVRSGSALLLLSPVNQSFLPCSCSSHDLPPICVRAPTVPLFCLRCLCSCRDSHMSLHQSWKTSKKDSRLSQKSAPLDGSWVAREHLSGTSSAAGTYRQTCLNTTHISSVSPRFNHDISHWATTILWMWLCKTVKIDTWQ